MSSHNLRLVFTPEAREDYEDILLYTLQQWGSAQHDRYEAAFERGLTLLLSYPDLGRARDELPSGSRVYPIEQHVVIYDVRRGMLRVLRILHKRQDIGRAVQSSL